MQQTIAKTIQINGIGLHSGSEVVLSLKPADANSGIVFKRTDVSDRNNVIPALWSNVVDTRLCTMIGNDEGVTVGTIEHLMAALRGCGIDNLLIELDGPEVPVMDGSSDIFVKEIDKAGLVSLDAPRKVIRILEPVSIEEDGKTARFLPCTSSTFRGEISFDHPSIGHQEREITLMNGNFRHDISKARTFGFTHEVEALRKAGLALGGSLDNAIVLDQKTVLNQDGLRFDDEFIRHKLLDAIGDIYLAGYVIEGAYEADKPGHAMNNALLHALFANESAFEIVEMQSLDEMKHEISASAALS